MNKSESIKNLAMALKKAQSEMGEVKFDSDNPFFKSRYASLGAIIEASKKALTNNGLSISQPTVTDDNGVGITTLLIHESGEWMESTITLPISEAKNIAQEAGKIITYLRRYSLASILNLYSDEDTDGEQTKKPLPKAQTKTDGKVWPSETIKALMEKYPKLNHPNHAVKLLELSKRMTVDTPVETVLGWAHIYRDARDNGKMDTGSAADAADQQVFGG